MVMALGGHSLEYFSRKGAQATAREILQQGNCWAQIPELLVAMAAADKKHIGDALDDPKASILFSGAGTSGYIGDILAAQISRIARAHCLSRHSTNLVSQPGACLPRGQRGLLFAFARSGNSPESVDALEKTAAIAPAITPVAVTCNDKGMLARKTREEAVGIACLMPPQTDDESFVMTSSFSTMTLFTAALCREALGIPRDDITAIARQSEAINADFFSSEVCALAASASRLVYLGSNALWGAAREAALKILEMTAGNIATMAETPLGFRHGPKSFVSRDSVVIVFASNDSYSQQFDKDIALEIARDGKAKAVIVAGGAAFFARFPELGAHRLIHTLAFADTLDAHQDDSLSVLYVNYGQLIGLKSAIEHAIMADNPSPDGRINRVVRGVTLYPYHG